MGTCYTTFSMKNDSLPLLLRLLVDNDIFLDETELKLYYQSHPDYPSLLSLTDTLGHFEVEHLAARLDKESGYEELPDSFIAHVSQDNGREFVFVKKKNGKANLLYPDGSKKSLDKKDFLKIWEGIVLVVEASEKDKNRKQAAKSLPLFLGVVALLLLGVIVLTTQVPLLRLFMLALTLGGFVVSFFIVKENMGLSSPFVAKLCNANEKTSCNAVLTSKGASIYKDFTLGDACIVYFSAIFLSLLVGLGAPFPVMPYWGISVVSVFVTLYSIYYQGIILKKWCTLCLLVVAVLWVQFVLLTLNSATFIEVANIPLQSLLTIAFSFVATLGLWLWLKPQAKQQQELIEGEIAHRKFKRKYGIFQSALANSTKVDMSSLVDMPSIALGNPQAPVVLATAISTSCGYCNDAYKQVAELSKRHPEQVTGRVYFNMNPTNKDNPYLDIALKMMEISRTETSEKTEAALDDWFVHKIGKDKWNEKWGAITPNGTTHQIVQAHFEWSTEHQINFTPATFLMGHLYPQDYQISDLELYLDNLK
jgi:uncharacterized membrane protein